MWTRATLRTGSFCIRYLEAVSIHLLIMTENIHPCHLLKTRMRSVVAAHVPGSDSIRRIDDNKDCSACQDGQIDDDVEWTDLVAADGG